MKLTFARGQTRDRGVEVHQEEVTSVETEDEGFVVTTDDGEYDAQYVMFATGARHDLAEDLESFIAILTVGRSDENSSISCITDNSSAGAYVELRAQAVHNESFREKFIWGDEILRDRLTRIIQRGIDDGVFREVDPIPIAEFILTAIEGTLFRHSVVDDRAESTQFVHEQLDEYIQHHLLATERLQ